MFLKIMNCGDNAPDEDSRATFTLHDHVATASFSREGGKAFVCATFEDGSDPERFEVPGNAYMMNQAGDTVAHFGAHPYVRGRAAKAA